jgi:hypothetical protein
VGSEYTEFQKIYMDLLVWDENAMAFRILAIVCGGLFAFLILCGIYCCIKRCCDRKKV